MKDIYNHKNSWFGHKLEMHGLKWIRFLILLLWYEQLQLVMIDEPSIGWKHTMVTPFGALLGLLHAI
jgi:hypothetical protein